MRRGAFDTRMWRSPGVDSFKMGQPGPGRSALTLKKQRLSRRGSQMLGVPRVAVIEVGVMRIPATMGAEDELKALAVTGRNGALHVGSAERNRLLAHVALSPVGSSIERHPNTLDAGTPAPYGISSTTNPVHLLEPTVDCLRAVIAPPSRANEAEIKTGIQDDNYIEVISGIKKGDEVVSGPYSVVARKLKKGDVVRKVKEDELFSDGKKKKVE